MHVYFVGIGGAGLSALAQLSLDCGFDVNGSDYERSLNTHELEKRGITVSFNQDGEYISQMHIRQPIDWVVYSSGVKLEQAELRFCIDNNIKMTKRDELLNYIIRSKNLKLIAIAGTHGKTTTTAMTVWCFKQLGLPVSYSIGSNISFGPSASYEEGSEYFVYECDEFDRNFLHFHPFASIIPSLDYDHNDTYPTIEDYQQAFAQFLEQTQEYISVTNEVKQIVSGLMDSQKVLPDFDGEPLKTEKSIITLAGVHNRSNAYLVALLLHQLLEKPFLELAQVINTFPGTQRRFETIGERIFSDYAHHPKEIKATLQLASEVLKPEQKLVVVYQPHQNTRQYEVQKDYTNCFDRAYVVYWLPTYLSRENPDLAVLTPQDLSQQVTPSVKVMYAHVDNELLTNLEEHWQQGDMVLFLGAGSIDDFARTFASFVDKNKKLAFAS